MVKNTERNHILKKEIREKYRCIRKEISSDVREEASARIAGQLFNEPAYQKARFIYCYASFEDEADTHRIIEESLRQGKRVALPRVRGKHRMEFCFIKSPADLKPGFLGIREPGQWCPKAPAPYSETMVIMPGIAFDRRGGRIGYGGGYYDAYLTGHTRCIKAALAYSAQIADELPSEPEDVKVDMIITEKELILCQQDCREIR